MLAATAALALVGTGGVGATAWSWWNAPPDTPYIWLSAEEAAFLVALARALYPPGGTPAMGGDEAGADHFVDRVLGVMPEFQRHGLKLLMHALDNAAYLQDLSPFRHLPPAAAEARLWSWLEGPVAEQRSAVQSLALLVGMAYSTHPEVAPHFARWCGCGYGL